MNNLCNMLLDLDSDEGIRIEDSKFGKKIYINRNLLGTYNILIRTNNKIDNKNMEKSKNYNILVASYLEEIRNYDNVLLVLEFLKKNTDKPDIWLY